LDGTLQIETSVPTILCVITQSTAIWNFTAMGTLNIINTKMYCVNVIFCIYVFLLYRKLTSLIICIFFSKLIHCTWHKMHVSFSCTTGTCSIFQ
jgi:hypothetical protein